MDKDEILGHLRSYMEELFEVPPSQVTMEAMLGDDLDLDSIDAIDLIVKMQDLTGQKISPDEFKTVRTVGDVVDRVHDLFERV